MDDRKGSETINQGGAPDTSGDERDAEHDPTGNVAEKGEQPSPAKRERGETTGADTGSAIDVDSAHDRAS